MSFTDRLKQAAAFVKSGFDKISDMFITDEVAKASMVMAAWVTAADGKIEESEIVETEKFITEFEMFKDLDKDILRSEYRDWCEKFNKHPEDAIAEAQMEIHPLRDKKDEAMAAIRLAVGIARSDGVFADQEKKVLIRACRYLHVDEEAFF